MKIWFILFYSSWLIADLSYWKGNIGQAKIYMELDCDFKEDINTTKTNRCDGLRYFYRSHLVDIMLEGTQSDTSDPSKMVSQKSDYDDNVTESFTLEYHKDSLYGIWKSKNKKFNVNLTRMPKINKWEDFSHLRESFYIYKRENKVKPKDKKELVMIREKFSNSLLFRLGNGFLAQSRNAINPILDTIQKKSSTFILECVSPFGYGSGVEMISGDIYYLSENLLGYVEKATYDCGGPHPDFYKLHQLYNLHTGKRYVLKDLIDFDKIPQKDENSWDKDNNFKAKKLRWLGYKAKGVALKPNKKLDEEKGYDPYDLTYWQYVDWAYEKNGIRIYLSFSSYLKCYRGDEDESYFLPFTLLEKYINRHFMMC